MNTSNPFHAVLALIVIGSLVCFALFRPNSVRKLFGVDSASGTDGEIQVLRDKLRARADLVSREMAAAAREYRRHEQEVRTLRAALGQLMRHEAIRVSEYPQLWQEASQGADPELVAEFESLGKQVAVARQDLATGGNPNEWSGILDEGRKKAERLADETKRRREVLLQLKEKFLSRRP